MARFDGTRLRPALLAVFGALATTNAILGGLLLLQHHESGEALVAEPPLLPKISTPVPPTTAATPNRAASPERAERQQAKVRPPVLLGPKDLAASLSAYCMDAVSGSTGAAATGSGWRCERGLVAARPIDMDAACRWLYGEDAWAGMLNDTNQRSWRCYRDPS